MRSCARPFAGSCRDASCATTSSSSAWARPAWSRPSSLRRLGVKVAVAERDRPGGDCLWTGCVPSKALLASARAAHTIRHADAYGLEAVGPSTDTDRVWSRLKAIQAQIAATDDDPERFTAMGVDVLSGAARLTSPTTVRVGESHTTRYVLLATGSRPALPAIDGLAEAAPLTSETIFALNESPRSVVMIGGGPIGVELAQALARLGVRVTILQRGPRAAAARGARARRAARRRPARRARPRSSPASRPTASRVAADGTKTVHAGEQSWTAAEVFVGAGRTPNVDGLGLEECGVKVGAQGVVVDGALRTSVKSIYRRGRRRRAPPLHPRRRLRGGARGAQHVPAGHEPRRLPRAVVHVHRSRARPRRPDRGAGARAARRRRGARLAPGPRALRPRPHGLRRRTASCGSSPRRGGSSARTCWRRRRAS